MKKKISMKDWEYIGKYNPAARWLRPYCSYTLEEIEGGFRRTCRIGLIAYILIFIPAHLLMALYCMWDGGLKEFEIEGRHLGYDNICEKGVNSAAYSRAKKVWEGNK